MGFSSILFQNGRDVQPAGTPAYSADLHIHQIIEAVCAKRSVYHIEDFYLERVLDQGEAVYRQQIMRDIDEKEIRQGLESFSASMRTMKQIMDRRNQLYYEPAMEREVLSAESVYAETLAALMQLLESASLHSGGMNGLKFYLKDYLSSAMFTEMQEHARHLKSLLDQVRYSLKIRGNVIEVGPESSAPLLDQEVKKFFKKFEGDFARGQPHPARSVYLNSVETRILDQASILYPEAFEALKKFAENYASFADPVITRFEREVQFYLAWLDLMDYFRAKGFDFCDPVLTEEGETVFAEQAFDMALGLQMKNGKDTLVTNSFQLAPYERIIIVTGPNQGGKTTFARLFGQIFWAGGLGLPVPGLKAQIFLPDQIFTHFERQEKETAIHGKLEDDILRIHKITHDMTGKSIVIMNEMFSSTSLEDALWLGRKILDKMTACRTLCLYVTFLDALASFGDHTVSMSSRMPDEQGQHLYQIIRRPADGKAYAMRIAEKYRITSQWIRRRIQS